MDKWKEAYIKAFKQVNWKKTFMNAAELMLFIFITSSVYRALIHFGVLQEVTNIWLLLGAWIATFTIGDYLLDRHDDYLFRRRIMKAAREIARFEGIDPKTLNYKDIKITMGKDGYVDIEIEIQEQPKKDKKK